MKRVFALTIIVMIVLAGFLWVADAWARVGGGGSSGSRGSRSYSAPVQQPSSPSYSSRPSAPPPTSTPYQTPQRSGWGGVLGGLLLGGPIRSLLFRRLRHRGFGGGLPVMGVPVV